MKRTKRQKIKASLKHVNSQLAFNANKSYSQLTKKTDADFTDKSNDLGSIKKELFKSLFVATLILSALMVLYWVS